MQKEFAMCENCGNDSYQSVEIRSPDLDTPINRGLYCPACQIFISENLIEEE